MTAITILNSSNVPTGPFTREQVAEKLQTGEISMDSLAFIEGLAQWTPLRDVLAKVDGAAVVVAPVSPATPVVAAPAYSYAATMQPPGHLVYGGFWLRFVAYLIDGLIISIPVVILGMILGFIVGLVSGFTGAVSHSSGSSDAASAMMGVGMGLIELVIWAVTILVAWLYFAKLESSPEQATFGKRAMGLKVTDLSGNRISFGHASGRFFGKILSGMTCYIGFIMAGFTEKKQALHDLIAGTLVVKG